MPILCIKKIYLGGRAFAVPPKYIIEPKNRGKLILFVQPSSILFVSYFVTAPLLVLKGCFVTPLLAQDLLRSYVVLPHPYAMYCL